MLTDLFFLLLLFDLCHEQRQKNSDILVSHGFIWPLHACSDSVLLKGRTLQNTFWGGLQQAGWGSRGKGDEVLFCDSISNAHFFFFNTSQGNLTSCWGEPGTIPVQWSSSICGYPSLKSGFCFKTSPLVWRIRIPKSFLYKTVFSALGYLRGLFSVTVVRNKQI